MRKSWKVFHYQSLFLMSFWSFAMSIVLQCGAQLPIHALNCWTELSMVLFLAFFRILLRIECFNFLNEIIAFSSLKF